jgi:(p)ppGpp synthase/HD superfamily hydrolase
VDGLLEQVGGGKLAGQDVLDKVYPEKGSKKRWLPRVLFGRRRTDNKEKTPKTLALPIRGNPSGIAMKFAQGHFPIPGDPIIGILIPEEGVLIYPLNAKELTQFEKTPERWIKLEWNIKNKNEVFLSRIVLQLAHEVGALAMITALIAEYGSNIDYLDLIRSDENFRTLHLDIEVRDSSHAKQIMMALQGLLVVHTVLRETEPLSPTQ